MIYENSLLRSNSPKATSLVYSKSVLVCSWPGFRLHKSVTSTKTSTSFPGPLSFSSLVVEDKGGKGERAWERGCQDLCPWIDISFSYTRHSLHFFSSLWFAIRVNLLLFLTILVLYGLSFTYLVFVYPKKSFFLFKCSFRSRKAIQNYHELISPRFKTVQWVTLPLTKLKDRVYTIAKKGWKSQWWRRLVWPAEI